MSWLNYSQSYYNNVQVTTVTILLCTYYIGIQYTPVLSISEEHEANAVTVTVDCSWTPAQILHNVVITYFVNISPTVPIILTGSTSCLLKIPYNIEYNLSITAATPCRSNATTFRILKYGENNVNPSNNMDFLEILMRALSSFNQDTMHAWSQLHKEVYTTTTTPEI